MGPIIDASTTIQEYKENISVTLKWLQHSHLNNVISSYLNINSSRNKSGDLDILCIAETKLDKSFPNNWFVYEYNQSIYTGYVAIWYLLNHTYLLEDLMILKFHLGYK